MSEIKLVVNGQEFQVNYGLLKTIADNFPDEAQYAPLARALLALNIPSITEAILESAKLELPQMDKIWAAGDNQIRKALLRLRDFRNNLTDEQARDIIESGDTDMLCSIAERCQCLYPSGSAHGLRLSGQMADNLMNHLAAHPDMRVLKHLHRNWQTPAKFRPSIRHMLECGLDIARGSLSGLTEDDLPLLSTLSVDSLKNIAYHVEDIRDRATRKKVVEMLCAHRDPRVRMSLASNSSAPRYAQDMLLNDPEPDVAASARDTQRIEYDD